MGLSSAAGMMFGGSPIAGELEGGANWPATTRGEAELCPAWTSTATGPPPPSARQKNAKQTKTGTPIRICKPTINAHNAPIVRPIATSLPRRDKNQAGFY